MSHEEKKPDPPNVATMNSTELEAWIKRVDQQHKQLMKSLRALLRARWAEEAADKMAKGESD